MARMPGVSWVGEHGSRSGLMARFDVVCLHTIVGYAPAHAAHFSTDAAGKIFQSRDTQYRSAANLHGNHRIIAVENEDFGAEFGKWNTNDGHAVPAFTPPQIEAQARICAWAHTTHGIPLVACPDSRPGSRGIAYHRQGVDGNWAGYAYGGRMSGGEVWTNHRGKVCPGDRRIAQIPQIIARAKQLVNGEDWFDMATEKDLKDAVRAVLKEHLAGYTIDGVKYPRSIPEAVKYTREDVAEIHAEVTKRLSYSLETEGHKTSHSTTGARAAYNARIDIDRVLAIVRQHTQQLGELEAQCAEILAKLEEEQDPKA